MGLRHGPDSYGRQQWGILPVSYTHLDVYKRQVLLDKYILGTECEVDAICDGENFLIPGIMEQVERTGVHLSLIHISARGLRGQLPVPR